MLGKHSTSPATMSLLMVKTMSPPGPSQIRYEPAAGSGEQSQVWRAQQNVAHFPISSYEWVLKSTYDETVMNQPPRLDYLGSNPACLPPSCVTLRRLLTSLGLGLFICRMLIPTT